jgi:hypothetical protein
MYTTNQIHKLSLYVGEPDVAALPIIVGSKFTFRYLSAAMLTTNRLGYSNSQKMASLSSLGGTLQLH